MLLPASSIRSRAQIARSLWRARRDENSACREPARQPCSGRCWFWRTRATTRHWVIKNGCAWNHVCRLIAPQYARRLQWEMGWVGAVYKNGRLCLDDKAFRFLHNLPQSRFSEVRLNPPVYPAARWSPILIQGRAFVQSLCYFFFLAFFAAFFFAFFLAIGFHLLLANWILLTIVEITILINI